MSELLDDAHLSQQRWFCSQNAHLVLISAAHCSSLRNIISLKPGVWWWGTSQSPYCFMHLKSVCTNLLGGEEKEERVFPNLPPRDTPQYRYTRGEAGLQKKTKIRGKYGNRCTTLMKQTEFSGLTITLNTRWFNWIWSPLMRQGYFLSYILTVTQICLCPIFGI